MTNESRITLGDIRSAANVIKVFDDGQVTVRIEDKLYYLQPSTTTFTVAHGEFELGSVFINADLSDEDYAQAQLDLPAPQTASDARTRVLDDILAERNRQIEVKGWTPEHDAEHENEGLAFAAVTYATPGWARAMEYNPHYPPVPYTWPWNEAYFNPTPDDRRKELVKAAALLVAEIERLDNNAS